ncbi:hypothetical protein GGS21DRAFT_492038 [Xylaria nigripes]|nr:hypothetical protein GGS21DRAFT_492038 [Xylaria nigripes]
MNRKRDQPNPPNNNAIDLLSTPSRRTGVDSQPSSSSPSGMPSTQPNHLDTRNTTPSLTDRGVRKLTGWHGSWLRVSKSAASTQIARENIMAFETGKADSSSKSDSQSTKTLRTFTETNIESSSTKQPEAVNAGDNLGHLVSSNQAAAADQGIDKPDTHRPSEVVSQAPSYYTGWLSWLSGSATAPVESEYTNDSAGRDHIALETAQEHQSNDSDSQSPLSLPPVQPPPPSEAPVTTKPTSSSWFGLWYSTTSAAPTTTLNNAEDGSVNRDMMLGDAKAKGNENVSVQDVPMPPAAPTPAIAQPPAGSTWAFWSRDTPARKANESASSAEQGELAVIGDGSETNPRTSNVEEIIESNNKQKELPIKSSKEQLPKDAAVKKTKTGRSQSIDIDQAPGSPSAPIAPPSKSTTASTHKVIAQNLLLPSFQSTYRMKENPPIMKQITRLIFRTAQPPTNHVFLSKETPRIKKAIAIGIHGLFPASYLRPMIGQPTGTSIRFANHCVESIRRWTESHGSGNCEIEKVALEGEGKIAERVDNLWTLLLNWIEHIKNADLIMLACHSQGVPVGIMLLAKLIDLGVLTNARIGVCAMAGVSLGPFPDYNKSGVAMLMGSVAELWQFADPESEISKRYEHALKTVVDHGARITYVGSIDDQLVPLESALYGPASHPYIHRAVFIDGRIHAPDFIAHLVGFALKLRNLGIPDHGLIRELSLPLAGSLYSGGGHSSLYDESQVYDLAIMHTLETTSVSGIPCQIKKHQGLTNPNPYILPWIMRGLIEEEIVKTELYSETAELLKQFDDWAPATKALKDVKYRLEAVRSKP